MSTNRRSHRYQTINSEMSQTLACLLLTRMSTTYIKVVSEERDLGHLTQKKLFHYILSVLKHMEHPVYYIYNYKQILFFFTKVAFS